VKAKDLTDKTLKDFVDAITDWHTSGVLKSDAFRRAAEKRYPSNVQALQVYEGDVLIEAGRRFSKMVEEGRGSKLW